ncbi:AFR443Cp [Eremothecium gossypii ATCC 10895]|uniref:DNA helicase n=1 Tax=Eremothecium gossypii (strain ATCC 10895 / CBS 109.51 / FGSC 9923 / NRRL Y-1056) TaxID=284811 RepID=Q752Y0_EREGS|nr:AFR443Cp [Eremothecium gossypii ATCC 10895]AAS53814.1 AFR443Cp [Eremothecium gossypii ATCC 10895]AEY98125.1 FAFR443Cp [Eremothecium gossypii FDAG1]
MEGDKPDFLKSILDSTADKEDDKRHLRYNVHEGIVFCVELSHNMYKPSPELEGKKQLLEILEALLELMEQLVAVMPDTGVGCYFFQCRHREAKQGIYELFPLRDVNVAHMKKVFLLLEGIRTGKRSLEEELPYDGRHPTSLDVVFTSIQDQFLQEVPEQRLYNNKKIFLFTDNDSPPEKESLGSRTRLRKVVDDLNDYYINFSTFFIGTEQRPFDESFYSDILKLGAQVAAEGSSKPLYDGPSTKPISVSYIRSRVLRKKEVRRLRYSCPLFLNEEQGLVVSVKGYAATTYERPGARYRMVYQHEDVQREAFSHRRYLDPDTGEEATEDLCKVYQIGDDCLDLPDDLENLITNFAAPTSDSFLRMLGSRTAVAVLPYYNNIHHVTFLVPDDSVYAGSAAVLASLHRTLRASQRAVVLYGKLRATSLPALYALAPAAAPLPDAVFILARLPFQEEVRKFPALSPPQASLASPDYAVLQKITSRIIDLLVLSSPYAPADFKNPVIATHFRLLSDHLFETAQDPRTDDTIARLLRLRHRVLDDPESRLAKYLRHWNAFYARHQQVASPSPTKYSKRRRP